jgi:hypothetical protein
VTEDTSAQEEEEGAQDSFFTTCGVLSAQTAEETTQKLLNQVYLHQLSAGARGFNLTAGLNPEVTVVDSFAQDTVSRYGEGEFHGIIIDTGAVRRSTAGLPQFKAF